MMASGVGSWAAAALKPEDRSWAWAFAGEALLRHGAGGPACRRPVDDSVGRRDHGFRQRGGQPACSRQAGGCPLRLRQGNRRLLGGFAAAVPRGDIRLVSEGFRPV